jgi:hypothetical protein
LPPAVLGGRTQYSNLVPPTGATAFPIGTGSWSSCRPACSSRAGHTQCVANDYICSPKLQLASF